MFEKLEESLERIKAELGEPIPDVAETPPASAPIKRGAKKVAKKAVKKVAKKSPAKKKASATSEKSENSVSLKDLAKEAGLTEQRARQKLRGAEVERNGRWSWEEGSRPLQAARKALGLT